MIGCPRIFLQKSGEKYPSKMAVFGRKIWSASTNFVTLQCIWRCTASEGCGSAKAKRACPLHSLLHFTWHCQREGKAVVARDRLSRFRDSLKTEIISCVKSIRRHKQVGVPHAIKEEAIGYLFCIFMRQKAYICKKAVGKLALSDI